MQDRMDVVDGSTVETLRLLVRHDGRSGPATEERVEGVLVERRSFFELGLQDLGGLRQRELEGSQLDRPVDDLRRVATSSLR